MSITDIVIISLIALFALIGLWKGFFKTCISMLGFLLSFVLAFFLASHVGEALLGIPAINGIITSSGGSFSLYQLLFTVVDKLPVDTLSSGFFAGAFETVAPVVAEGQITLQQAMSLYYADVIFNIIVGVALFIVARLLLSILTMFLKSLTKKNKLGAGNRIMGFVMGAVRGGVWSAVLLYIVSLVVGITSISFVDTINKDIQTSVIAKPVLTYCDVVTDKFIRMDGDYFLRVLDKSGLTLDLPTEDEENLRNAFLEINTDSEGNAYNAAKYESIDFDEKVSAILNYNTAAAAKVPELELSEDEIAAFLTAIQDEEEGISVKMEFFVTALDALLIVNDEERLEMLEAVNTAYDAVVASYTSSFTDVFGALTPVEAV